MAFGSTRKALDINLAKTVSGPSPLLVRINSASRASIASPVLLRWGSGGLRVALKSAKIAGRNNKMRAPKLVCAGDSRRPIDLYFCLLSLRSNYRQGGIMHEGLR